MLWRYFGTGELVGRSGATACAGGYALLPELKVKTSSEEKVSFQALRRLRRLRRMACGRSLSRLQSSRRSRASPLHSTLGRTGPQRTWRNPRSRLRRGLQNLAPPICGRGSFRRIACRSRTAFLRLGSAGHFRHPGRLHCFTMFHYVSLFCRLFVALRMPLSASFLRGTLVGGRIADAVGPRPVLVVCGSVCALAYFGAAVATEMRIKELQFSALPKQ